MTVPPVRLLPLLTAAALLAAACGGAATPAAPAGPDAPPEAPPAAAGPDVAYTLRTGGPDGALVYVGVGGAIEGQINPTLTAEPGQTVMITLVNGDGVIHDLVIDEFHATSAEISQPGDLTSITFTAGEAGEYAYYCSIPGHRQAGMFGTLRVGDAPSEAATGASIVRHPADLPPPLERRGPTELRVELVAEEIVGQLADGATLTYFTFNGQVPGPFVRVRVGDTVELHLRNETSSLLDRKSVV